MWFIDLTVATCHIQYIFLFSFSTRKHTKYENTRKSAIFVWYENGGRRLLGAQSIDSERASLNSCEKKSEASTGFEPTTTFVCPSVRQFVCSFVRPSVHSFVRPFVRLSVRSLFVCSSVRPSLCLFVRPSVRPSVRPFIFLNGNNNKQVLREIFIP